MLSAILTLGGLALLAGLGLGYAGKRLRVEEDPLVEKVDAILPQTQCGQCGYPGCKPYAEALANGEADINLCPPGGERVIRELAELLGVAPKPLDGAEPVPKVAVIDESACIGCTLCLKACPVDAIVGAVKQYHTVVRGACTGCELCLAPCPADCITMQPLPPDVRQWRWSSPDKVPPSAPSAEENQASDDAPSASKKAA
ncbi:MAG: electron transport complex subunit RsxB [Alphaproteobacteria bacterium CG_4_10_14_0_2_um_filter_63_37]|nr:MAG: electron transport complex subunit RsxB [Proteobacteria bacterium CG1_02_64_396]PJA26032.1 MAG: electron transport complex subunit RsxB [Alphaproteobacteria bacterium CG_4_10_14_0_2_um_filter_63_37]